MTSLPFIIFDARHRNATAYGVLLPLSLFIGLEIWHFDFVPQGILLDSTPWTYVLTVATAFAMAFLALFSYRRANELFEIELRESQGRFVRVVEVAQEGIVVCDDNGKIVYANPAFAKRLGLSQRRIVGKSIMDFINPAFHQRILDHVLHHQKTEVEFIRSDGKRLTTWLSTSPLYENRPNSTAHVGLILDMTEAREKERLIEQQRSQLIAKAKLSSLGEMAAGIAHEVYNPLTSIRLAAGILRRFFSGGSRDYRRAKKVADQMETTIERIVHIIDGLKTFSQDDTAVSPSDVALGKIVRDTLSLCGERFRVHAIDLRVAEMPPQLTVRVRPIEISQVLLHLLNNSFHAVLGQRDRRVRVDFRVLDTNHTVEVSVTDSGPGIPPQLQDRIFEPFFTTKPPGEGTGLGLSVSKRIIESHGGQLQFDSMPGKVIFSFTVPLAHGTVHQGRAA
jgi:PAS domain S-box-containing protein